MKTGPYTLGTAANESGSIKHENGTRRPRYRRKRVKRCKTLKRDPKPPELPNTSLSAQNKKTRPNALDTAENEFGRAKIEKTGPPVTAENESVSPKRKNETRHPWLLSKTSPGAQNIKTGPDALGTAENEFGSAKHDNGTRRPLYRRKLVWEHKT
jgi:hypothetical protein